MPGDYQVTSDNIFVAMTSVVTSPIADMSDLPNRATETNRLIKMLEISGPGDRSKRSVALIVGGQHAREWAPPDAVFSFAKNLVEAYDAGTDLIYPATSVRSVNYPLWRVQIADIRRIVDNLVILAIPTANPDGRDVSLAGGLVGNDDEMNWRGNRNLVACPVHGVDINRNYNIGWDPLVLKAGERAYYSKTDLGQIISDGGFTPDCTLQNFHGPGAGSEKEVQNVQHVIDTRKVSYFVDVHSYGRWILRPWGIAGTQKDEPNRNFRNPGLDRTTTGGGRTVTDNSYKEYMPDTLPQRLLEMHSQIAGAMQRAILQQAGTGSEARRRSTYRDIAIPQLYKELRKLPRIVPVPGSSTDYALSRQFKTGETQPALAFSIECGSEFNGEGRFFPSKVVYEKVEREVHAALFALLKKAVDPRSSVTSPPNDKCFIATAAYGSAAYPKVERLRQIRAEALVGSPRVVGMLNRCYCEVSPPIARFLVGRPRARAVARAAVVNPAYALLHTTSVAARRVQGLRAQSPAMLGAVGTMLIPGVARILRVLSGNRRRNHRVHRH